MANEYSCPICKSALQHEPRNESSDVTCFDCPRCGEFDLAGSALGELPGKIDQKPQRRALFSHRLRRMQGRKPPLITSYDLESMWPDDRLPSPLQQEIDLLLFIGDRLPSGGALTSVALPFICAWLGTDLSLADLHWLVNVLTRSDWIEHAETETHISLKLTMEGWRKYSELKRQQVDSRVGFMALKFGDPELDNVVTKFFKPAVADTGFTLRGLTDGQPAGLIDNQLRAALVGARFVVADLSHGNNGAYWEAGFAEGLGRPVIYTCKKEAWDKQRTHFDTNHMTTIIWDPANLEKAGADLAATIRNTFRAEAKQ